MEAQQLSESASIVRKYEQKKQNLMQATRIPLKEVPEQKQKDPQKI